ncbi:hypothetical protein BT67DRAFT_213375 [Trichocladium antarcticum]|uniref:Uncharacterized protein n=1 Tax=Trichocladium antarcticum TaxID=1450529 RepID=A0AAN6UDP7_9PEZI|nr:hypothetical protein BT67DRAFT_213375 [Trichocladium antarcticum]
MPTRPPRRHSAVLPSHFLGGRGTCSSHRLSRARVHPLAHLRHLVSSRTAAFSPFPNVEPSGGGGKLAVAPTLHMPCQARQGIPPRKRAPLSLSAARGSSSLDLQPVAWLTLSAAAKRRHLSPHFCDFKWPQCHSLPLTNNNSGSVARQVSSGSGILRRRNLDMLNMSMDPF